MKKNILLSVAILLLLFSDLSVSYAEEQETKIDTNNIIQSQKNNLGITDFLQEAKRVLFRFIRRF